MQNLTRLFISFSLMLAFIGATHAEVPNLINLQGYLVDDLGPVTGDYEATFRIYDAPENGTILWSETDSVNVENGLYSQILGESIPIDISWADDRWIGVQFTGHPEMTPRYKQTTVPFTFMANYSDSAGTVTDDAITSLKILDGTIQEADLSFTPLTRPLTPGIASDEIADDAVTTSKILDGAITSAKILDGAIGLADLAQNGAANGQIMKWDSTSSSWIIADDETGGGGSGGGWVDDGTIIRLETETDKVGIGVSDPYEKLEINGNVKVSGRLAVGWNSTVSGQLSSITGGSNNTTLSSYSIIGNGMNNTVEGSHSGIVSGWKNYIGNTYAFVGSGYADTVYSQYGGIASGHSNKVGIDGGFTPGSFIGGGQNNRVLSRHSVIGGGYGNTVSGNYSAILGGSGNNIQSGADYSYLFGYGSVLSQDSTFMVDMPRIHFGDMTTGYEFPTSDGTGGQVMSTDGTGQLSWVDMGGGGGETGWVDDGTVVRLETSTDNVGIGTATPTAKLDIFGDLKARKGNLGFQNTNTGDNSFVAGYQNDASGLQSAVGGGFGNTASAIRSSVSGGSQNSASGGNSAILGGQYNSALADYSTIGSGRYDTVHAVGGGVLSGFYNVAGNSDTDSAAFVGGGSRNSATAKYTVVSGGYANQASTTLSTISGGSLNSIQGAYGTIGGGRLNTVSAAYGGVLSGNSNTAGANESDSSAVVAGGKDNYAYDKYSSITGGWSNAAVGNYSFIGGGKNNTARGYSVVAGGSNNLAGDLISDEYSSVAGGYHNRALDSYSVIGGGQENQARGVGSVIGGGSNNFTRSDHSAVFGGQNNMAGNLFDDFDSLGFIGGGASNIVEGGIASAIVGGRMNSIDAEHSNIGGGRLNIISGVGFNTIGGGRNNEIGESGSIARSSVIAGGRGNTITEDFSAIGGGFRNTISSDFSSISGGDSNFVYSDFSAILGGQDNVIWDNSPYSTILGGFGNTIEMNAEHSIILGGNYNSLANDYSLAFGEFASAGIRTVSFYDNLSQGCLSINRGFNGGGYLRYPIQSGTIDDAGGRGAHLTDDGYWRNWTLSGSNITSLELDREKMLTDISSLTIESKENQESREKHIGPSAEDFVAAFDVGTIRESDGKREDRYLAALDVAGVALAGVQELINIIEKQNDRIEKLEQKIDELGKGR